MSKFLKLPCLESFHLIFFCWNFWYFQFNGLHFGDSKNFGFSKNLPWKEIFVTICPQVQKFQKFCLTGMYPLSTLKFQTYFLCQQVNCVVSLGKTLLSQCLFPPRCINGYWQIIVWATCERQAFHPDIVIAIFVAASFCSKWS